MARGAAIVAFLAAGWAAAAHAPILLAGEAVMVDAATQLNLVLGQRVPFSITPGARGRINAVNMTMVFLAGALGITLATVNLDQGG